MEKSKIYLYGFVHALAVVAYCSLVVVLMEQGAIYLGGSFKLGAVMMLVLITLSVAVVGSLIFVRPAIVFINGLRKEAVWLLVTTLTFLFILFIVIGLVAMSTYVPLIYPAY